MTDIVERLHDPSKGAPRWLDTLSEAADEIERLRAALDLIATMRPRVPQDAEGYGPNWDQYIYTRTWALFAASLQDTARSALGGER